MVSVLDSILKGLDLTLRHCHFVVFSRSNLNNKTCSQLTFY